MIDWDLKYLQKLEKYNILPALYSRFKDDILMATKRLKNGSKIVNGKVIIDESKITEDESKTASKITFEILKEIAEEVDPMLKFTIDTPCSHDDNKIPVLDLKVNVNKKENQRIDFEFYEKPTKHKQVILSNSALSMDKKRTILTQECLRIIRNTKSELGVEVRNRYLSNFMVKLKRSGYNQKFRIEVLDSALKAFEKMVEEDKNGQKPLFRDRLWNFEERMKAKQSKKLNWYKNGKNSKYTSILMVPPTPGSVLVKELQRREEEVNRYNDERFKMVETGGIKIEDILSKKNPFKKEKCEENDCPLCKSAENQKIKALCSTNNVGYRWTCENCKIKNLKRVYEGESSRSARIRGKEHLRGLKNKNPQNMLYKHKFLEHPEEENVNFKMEITGLFRDALTRQADEAVRIKNCEKSELLNSKSQFNNAPITRIVINRER